VARGEAQIRGTAGFGQQAFLRRLWFVEDRRYRGHYVGYYLGTFGELGLVAFAVLPGLHQDTL